jgi:hypothetical protein
MKNLFLLIACGIAVFLGSFGLSRSTTLQSTSKPPQATSSGGRDGSTKERFPSSSSSNSSAKRQDRDEPAETLLVPPGFVELIDIAAFDSLDGGFSPEFTELLGLDDQELVAAKEAFDIYFKAFTQVELTLATRVSTEERAGDKPGDERFRRFKAVRIEPAGDRLKEELQALRERLVDRLGRPRGLTAAAIISRQLGNNGSYGEHVAFGNYVGEEKYRMEISIVDDRGRVIGHSMSGPIHDTPDFSVFARYRHLDGLIRK